MKLDIVEFVESTLDIKLKEYQKKFLRTYYEHKDEMTEPLYLNVGRSQKKVSAKVLQALEDDYALQEFAEDYGLLFKPKGERG